MNSTLIAYYGGALTLIFLFILIKWALYSEKTSKIKRAYDTHKDTLIDAHFKVLSYCGSKSLPLIEEIFKPCEDAFNRNGVTHLVLCKKNRTLHADYFHHDNHTHIHRDYSLKTKANNLMEGIKTEGKNTPSCRANGIILMSRAGSKWNPIILNSDIIDLNKDDIVTELNEIVKELTENCPDFEARRRQWLSL